MKVAEKSQDAVRKATQTIGGFRFTRPYAGSVEWRVYDAETDERLGTVRPNGSRIRERSWTARRPNGEELRASSRASAANRLKAGR